MPQATADKSRVIIGAKKKQSPTGFIFQHLINSAAMGSSSKKKKEKSKDFQVRMPSHQFL